jgi:hypothetical protein
MAARSGGPQHLKPFRFWHQQVPDHQVRAAAPKTIEPFPAIGRFEYGVAGQGEVFLEDRAEAVIVPRSEGCVP